MPSALDVDWDMGDRPPYLRARGRAPGAVAGRRRRPDPNGGAESSDETDFVTTLCDPALAAASGGRRERLAAVLPHGAAQRPLRHERDERERDGHQRNADEEHRVDGMGERGAAGVPSAG